MGAGPWRWFVVVTLAALVAVVLVRDEMFVPALLLVIGLLLLQQARLAASARSREQQKAQLDEERLRRASEERFRALVDNSSDLVMVVGSDGLVSFCSPAVERLLGVADVDLVGRPPFERLHPDDGWRVPPLLDHPAGLDASAEPLEVRLAHEDGTYRWFEVLTKDLRSDLSVDGIVL
ncbi:hypothetical protein B7486_73925, partial [cyanobacterium TDX16]